LQHPGIAQVYAAGTEESEGGTRPWIAMELVRGTPLLEFAREHELDRPARLELVARIADAVHHAHQRGIIHRDLKSANVLVDEAGDPKVLDFGVARAEGAELRATLTTTPGLIVGTLQTMSPEQAEASPDLDARTDVYSLGAIAYELLSGRPPLELTALPLSVALLKLLQDEPIRLGAIDRSLAGDIQVVVSKALEKQRDRRYASAAAFAADLRRILCGEPVEAHPPSTMYLLSKLARRHRGLAIGAGLALLASAAGLVAFALQSRATARAERAAAQESRASAAIDDFLLQDLIRSPDPRVKGRDVRVLDVLEGAAAHAEEVFAEDPELLARVRSTLGKSFLALDELELAEVNLRSALAWLVEHRGERFEGTLETESTLIELLAAREAAEEAEPLARSSLARQREVLGRDHPTTLATATNLATVLMRLGELEESESILLEVIEARERTRGVDDTTTLLAHENLAVVLLMDGRILESIRRRASALALRRARYGDRDPGTLLARLNLASSQLGARSLPDSISTFEGLLEEMRLVFGERHHQTSRATMGLAGALARAGRVEEALERFEEVVLLRREVLGPGHTETLDAQLGLIQALASNGMFEEAAGVAQECLAEQEAFRGNPFSLGLAQLVAGETQIAVGRVEQGRDHLEAALQALEGIAGPAPKEFRARARAGLARTEVKQD
jgi:tetratricopeptide (TPR) repeat protein